MKASARILRAELSPCISSEATGMVHHMAYQMYASQGELKYERSLSANSADWAGPAFPENIARFPLMAALSGQSQLMASVVLLSVHTVARVHEG